eukprot:11518719-Alexandrium_andersonii.AAC.1
MSASLVGSEMCIRDRATYAGSTLLPHNAARPTIEASTQRRGLCGTVQPVSYTHLTLPTICSV